MSDPIGYDSHPFATDRIERLKAEVEWLKQTTDRIERLKAEVEWLKQTIDMRNTENDCLLAERDAACAAATEARRLLRDLRDEIHRCFDWRGPIMIEVEKHLGDPP